MADEPGQPDFSHLISILANSKVQQTNNALYQTLYLLIKGITQSRDSIVVNNNNTSQSLTQLLGVTYLTEKDETVLLINSRRFLAGSNVSFDDSVPGARVINASGGGSGSNHYDSPLSDGDLNEANLIFASGECIIVQVPA